MAQTEKNAVQFAFDLVSPERKLVSDHVWQVVVPGSMGDLGVRAGHMSLVVSLRPGIVEITRHNASTDIEKFFVAGGFADINAQQCTILAEEAVPVQNLKIDVLESQLQKLQEQLAISDQDSEKTRLRERIEIVQTMISAVA
jgi:F-type H+-transporting ATPase subunit epsilon